MIPGGGPSLVHAIKALKAKVHDLTTSTAADEKIGSEIIRRSLEEPLSQVAENAGFAI